MKDSLLIVDDVEINRAILAETFKNEYNIIEAANGIEAIRALKNNLNISAVMLDLVMPEMGGMDVLREMNKTGDIFRIPVFIVTSCDSEDTFVDAYELGAVDVIAKPFIFHFLKCRVANIIELYRHRNNLETTVNEQLARLNSMNRSMVETLASVIEFRNCESGEHVKRISFVTNLLMTAVSEMYSEYYCTKELIDRVSMASVLHDVGKISIPDVILNKPAKLTHDEFEIMKGHTVRGCEILSSIPNDMMDKDVYDMCYDVCRHHHERWDGGGYPDGLKGDDISVYAQVVAIADVYDALTSPRVYKAAYSHEKALEMIFNGECGCFNPKILKAFEMIADKIKK
ncbi:MAG: response regulator [Ruminococcaceae bacterium]|nr:response regulator [Oscillospiraceae bacterium]MBD5116567.1 response regulator [Oscillospiraceae bacterium]